MEHEELFRTLLGLSQKKEIPYSKRQLEKMSPEKLQFVYEEYKQKELGNFNEALSDMVIFKFDEYMKKYDFIRQDSQFGKKLQNKKLFKQDLKSVISYVTPFLPFVGLIEGGVTVASEMFDNYLNKNESTTFKTEEGGKHDQNSTDSSDNKEQPDN